MNRDGRSTLLLALTLAVIAGTTACATRPLVRQVRSKSQEDVGSSHVSVLSVVDWESAKSKLQPNFAEPKTWDMAKDASVATTARIDERLLDAFTASLKVGLAQVLTNSTKTTNTAADGTATTTSSVTEERKPGKAPTGDSVQVPGKSDLVDRPDLAGVTASIKGEPPPVSLDPMLQYLAGTALKQEVAMLNMYVNSAPMPKNFEAYVVRLQVSLHPNARNQPYDAYTTLSFLPLDTEKPAENAVPGAPDAQPQRQAMMRIDAEAFGAQAAGAVGGIRVVPLLVTDNFEAILRSGSRERIRDFVLGVSAILKGVDVNGGMGRRIDDFQSLIATDLNSLMTVGRASDNSVRVRFGAAQIGPSDFSMTSRTHNVTVLLMVPRTRAGADLPPVKVVSKTEFVDATTGKLVDAPRRTAQARRAKALLAEAGALGRELARGDGVVEQLMLAAQTNNFGAFMDQLSKVEGPANGGGPHPVSDLSAMLWVDFVALMARSPYAVTTLDLAGARIEPKLPDQAANVQYPLVESAATASTTITGGRYLQSRALTAYLEARHQDGRSVRFPARVEVLPGGDELRVLVDGIREKLKSPRDFQLNLTLQLTTADGTIGAGTYECFLVEEPALRITSKQRKLLIQDNKTASLELELDLQESDGGSIGFEIDHQSAVIASQSPEGVVSKIEGRRGWKVEKNGTVTLTLSDVDGIANVAVYRTYNGRRDADPQLKLALEKPASPPQNKPAPGVPTIQSKVSRLALQDGGTAKVSITIDTLDSSNNKKYALTLENAEIDKAHDNAYFDMLSQDEKTGDWVIQKSGTVLLSLRNVKAPSKIIIGVRQVGSELGAKRLELEVTKD